MASRAIFLHPKKITGGQHFFAYFLHSSWFFPPPERDHARRRKHIILCIRRVDFGTSELGESERKCATLRRLFWSEFGEFSEFRGKKKVIFHRSDSNSTARASRACSDVLCLGELRSEWPQLTIFCARKWNFREIPVHAKTQKGYNVRVFWTMATSKMTLNYWLSSKL